MIAKLIPEIALMTAEDDHEYRRRPSLAGPERCIRQLVYNAAGRPPQPWPGRTLMVFDDSGWHEELTADWIRKSAYDFHSSQLRVDTHAGPGSIDGIITDLRGVDYLLEHKALNHFGFERIWNGDLPLDYFTQLALYMEGVQRTLNPDLRRGLLLIKNKNTAQYIEFLVEYLSKRDALVLLELERSDGEVKRFEPEIVLENITRNAAQKFDSVDKYVAEGKLPPRPHPPGTTFPCGYCRWGPDCWDGFSGELEGREAVKVIPSPASEIPEGLGLQIITAKQVIKQSEKLVDDARAQIIGAMELLEAKSIVAGRVTAELVERKRSGKAFYVLNVRKIVPEEIQA